MTGLGGVPARRSCQQGGTWKFYQEQDGHKVVAEEMASLFSVTPLQQKMLKAEFRSKMGAAEKGELEFGKGEDVDAMGRHPDILEIRFAVSLTVDDGSVRLYRLYFSEPVRLPAVLLGLRWASKPPGRAGLATQDADIDLAYSRLTLGQAWLWGDRI